MSEEEIERLREENDIAIEKVKSSIKEIKRLNKELQDTKEHLGEYLYEQEEENKRLHSIIKEVREIVEEKANEEIGGLSNKLLEILDKELI